VISCLRQIRLVMMASLREYNATKHSAWVLSCRVRLLMGIIDRSLYRVAGVILLWVLLNGPAWSEIRVVDDTGQTLTLEKPAQRIVSLAPHITELLFAVGAGAALVGTSEFSDYPEAARAIPRVGGGGGLDLEAILALQPDLVIAWESGNPAGQARRLQQLGLPVFFSEPSHMEDIISSLERFGQLTGRQEESHVQATAFADRLEALRRRYSGQDVITVYYQIWDHPLMTVNGRHIVSDVIRLCGGRNVFADLPVLAPQIDSEAVLAANPDVIVVGDAAGEPAASLVAWTRWPELKAVNQRHLYTIQRELLVRHTPRLLEGAGQLCRLLENVREQRKQTGN
jgi:iron complex transport system substrate-binding protein